MEYHVVRRQARNLEAGFAGLEVEVNERLSSGWQLVGGLCVAPYELGFVFTQAVQRVRPLPSNNRTTLVNVDTGLVNPNNRLFG